MQKASKLSTIASAIPSDGSPDDFLRVLPPRLTLQHLCLRPLRRKSLLRRRKP